MVNWGSGLWFGLRVVGVARVLGGESEEGIQIAMLVEKLIGECRRRGEIAVRFGR